MAALLCAPRVRAADHLDAPGVSTSGKEMADINDVYAWMTSDGSKVNLALTVSPADDGSRHFGATVQYVFHVEQHAAFGMAGTESKIICTFTSDTAGQCWLTNPAGDLVDYVSGDFSVVAGKASDSNKVRVFAGRRSDPFFFNLTGFLKAKKTVNDVTLDVNLKGCPTGIGGTAFTDNSTPAALRTQLADVPDATTPGTTNQGGPCATGTKDCFATFNVMAIVLQVDKDLLVTAPNKLISVWASTHATP